MKECCWLEDGLHSMHLFEVEQDGEVEIACVFHLRHVFGDADRIVLTRVPFQWPEQMPEDWEPFHIRAMSEPDAERYCWSMVHEEQKEAVYASARAAAL